MNYPKRMMTDDIKSLANKIVTRFDKCNYKCCPICDNYRNGYCNIKTILSDPSNTVSCEKGIVRWMNRKFNKKATVEPKITSKDIYILKRIDTCEYLTHTTRDGRYLWDSHIDNAYRFEGKNAALKIAKKLSSRMLVAVQKYSYGI